MEGDIQFVEVGDDEQSSWLGSAPLQTVAQIDRRDHHVTRHKDPLDRRVRVGNRRHLLKCDDLLDLCHIDTVAMIVDHKLQYLQFICAAFH